MDHRGLLLAAAALIAPVLAIAEPVRHPAEPGSAARAAPPESPFVATVPLLDRATPNPSYEPAGSSEKPASPAEAVSGSHHGGGSASGSHAGMSHGSDHHGHAGMGQAPAAPTQGGTR